MNNADLGYLHPLWTTLQWVICIPQYVALAVGALAVAALGADAVYALINYLVTGAFEGF